MTNEQYIEHEVKIRLHSALFKHLEYKIDKIESRVDRIDAKMNGLILLVISGFIMPLILKHYGI